jgi:prepilin-type processing-associated H-X9-DG protein
MMRLENSGAKCQAYPAFTLVELLAISLVLSGMLLLVLPTLARARQKSIDANCQSNLRRIGLAIQTYAASHGDSLPGPVLALANARYDLLSSNQISWFLAESMGTGRPSETTKVARLFLCPAQDFNAAQLPPQIRANYVLHDGSQGGNENFGAPFGRLNPAATAPLKLSALTAAVNPARCVAMQDADKGDVNPTVSGWKELPYQPVHGKSRNQLFFDWHAASKNW